MKHLFIILFLVITQTILSQNKKTDTFFHRLLILNDKEEILVVKFSDNDYWVTPGLYESDYRLVEDGLYQLALDYGITISQPKFKGSFKLYNKTNSSLSIRNVYTTKYVKGVIKKPKGIGVVTWLPLEKALKNISFPHINLTIEKVLKKPNKIWGGELIIYKEDNRFKTKVLKEFYQLNYNKNKIEKTLHNYMYGSSYNNKEQIKSAFILDATLYLTGRDGSFKKYTPQEYANFFKNKKSGEFNGRIAKILEVEITKDIATAKVEITGPERKWIYIDLFLLKKLNNEWKIISKTATRVDNPKKKDILFVVSNAHFYGNTKLPTGNSFSEIVNAYDVFKDAGYNVDFVSPKGGAIPLAYINTSDKEIKEYLYDISFMNKLKNTLKPSEVVASNYSAVQYIGGGAAMFGVPENKEIQKISMDIYENYNGVISSVCHGTAGIVNLKTKDGNYLVNGKRVSGYPDDYENPKKPYFKTFPFLIKKTIQTRGGDFRFTERGKFIVETDGRLVTGQNYQSSKPVSLKIIEILEK
ncbi:MAG: nuclear transport factor 2 family protein [Flavobacteriaceae bacterium]